MKIALNVLLHIIDKSKRMGKGSGRGQIAVRLIDIISDTCKNEHDNELAILSKFGYSARSKKELYSQLNGIIRRFILTGNEYPYKQISLIDFEKSIGTPKYNVYLSKMSKFCDDVLDTSKYDFLVYTLLEIIRRDSNFTKILYGNNFVQKEQFFGNFAHPKKICVEAFLLGLLYHTHKNWAVENTEKISLFPLPDRLNFQPVRWKDEDSLNLEITLNLEKTISENSKRPYAIDEKIPAKIYPVQIFKNDKILTNISADKNAFIYGSGGIGKTTFLNNLTKNNTTETVYFYFPLYKYHEVFIRKFTPESCYLLTQILLKYFYQFEYQTIESAIAFEGENTIIKQLTELNALLKNNPVDLIKKYVLLLDGMNEISSELQEKFIAELERICHEWRNVRFVITSRNASNNSIFSEFEQYELCGISDSERDKILSENKLKSTNSRLLELLKNPLFLNVYIENHGTENTINTRGEILDNYIENYKIRTSFDEKVIQFLIKFALPFAARFMISKYDLMTKNTAYEIDRGTVSKAIENAFEFYIETEMVYQNFIVPKGIRKKFLLEYKEKYDFVDILIDNTCFLKASKIEPHKLHFSHQYFRDYFTAKYFLNMLEAIEISYENDIYEMEKMFNKYDLGDVWFNDNEFEIYRLIGEIFGDYKNIYSEDFVYTKTILDRLLDMSRKFDTFRTTENVINTMSAVRGNVICGVDFSYTSLPLSIPRNLKFSMNGDEPCRFNGSHAVLLEILNDYDGNRVYDDWCDDLIDERLNPEILSKLDNFKGCDFTGARFLEPEYKKLLKATGAITD